MPALRHGMSDGVTLRSNQIEQDRNPMIDTLGKPLMAAVENEKPEAMFSGKFVRRQA